MSRIVLDAVSKHFPGGTTAVKSLDLEVSDGELLVLVGPSGCGKTTALRMVAGLEKIRGRLTIPISIDTQKAAVLAALSIADELYSLRKERGNREELLKEQAERCLTLVERALRKTE